MSDKHLAVPVALILLALLVLLVRPVENRPQNGSQAAPTTGAPTEFADVWNMQLDEPIMEEVADDLLALRWRAVEGVKWVGAVIVHESGVYVTGQADVEPKARTLNTAQMLLDVTRRAYSELAGLTVSLYDGTRVTVYSWQRNRDEWHVTPPKRKQLTTSVDTELARTWGQVAGVAEVRMASVLFIVATESYAPVRWFSVSLRSHGHALRYGYSRLDGWHLLPPGNN